MNNLTHITLDEADTLLDDSFHQQLTHFITQQPVRCIQHNFYDALKIMLTAPFLEHHFSALKLVHPASFVEDHLYMFKGV